MGLLIWFEKWQCRACQYDGDSDLRIAGNKITTAAELVFRAKTRTGILLTSWFSTFTLDIETRISWAFDIDIRRFKNPNSSTHIGLQLLWRIQSHMKWSWRTESGRNLVGKKKDLLIWFENWQCRASLYDWESDLRTVGLRT